MAAEFPTTAPTVYTDKSTANDVGDTAHWDGADANQVKDEIIAVAAKVGVDGDPNTSSHDYKLTQIGSHVDDLESRTTELEGHVADLESRTTTLESDVENLDSRTDALEARKEVKTGSGTLSASTTTTVTDANVTTGSTVLVQATSAGFVGLDPIPYVSAVNSGSFVLTHGSAAGSETFDYIVVN